MENSITVPSSTLATLINTEVTTKGGKFTVQSKRTGKDYTYKIKRSSFNGNMFTHVYVETGYLNFTHLGFYAQGKVIKKAQPVQTNSAEAIAYILNLVENRRFEKLDEQVAIFHTGKCLRCGRTLTDATSIKAGLGPTCINL